jgi:tripartite-type tricarboxylate transporter receptor subunit TctC
MISRRKVLELGSAVIGGRVLVGSASAQDAWPSGDIKTICPFPAGTGADIVVRFYAKVLQDAVKRTVIVENRPGAFGNIATEAIARSKPDGYTVGVLASSAIAAAPALYKSVPFDPIKDFDQVTTLMRVPWFLIVSADGPFKTVADLTDHLKVQGDKGSYGSVANSGLVSSELYKLKFGLQTVEVKYKDPFLMLNDLYAGNIAFAHLDATTTIGSMKQGKSDSSPRPRRRAPRLSPTCQAPGRPASTTRTSPAGGRSRCRKVRRRQSATGSRRSTTNSSPARTTTSSWRRSAVRRFPAITRAPQRRSRTRSRPGRTTSGSRRSNRSRALVETCPS